MDTMQGSDPTKVSGRRFGAFVIDWVILVSVVPFLLFLATAQLTIYTDGPTCRQLEQIGEISEGQPCATRTSNGEITDTYTYESVGIAAYSAFQILYIVIVLWFVQGTTGITVGKLLFGIRTVNQDGTGPGIGKQFIRGILWLADAIVCGIPILAGILILATKRHQRVGDLAARTFVVRSSARGLPVPAAGSAAALSYPVGGVAPTPYPVTPPVGSTAYPAAPPVSAPAPDFATPDSPPPPTGFGGLTGPADETTAFDAGSIDATTVESGSFATPGGDAPTVQPTAPSGETPATGGPQWDPARNTYIQWDETRQTWLAYDETAGEWKPIS